MLDLSALPGLEIIKPLGEGGMGTVFLARQTEPVDRFVALKVINGRFHSQTALARFQQEQQALARLTHENIAQLYDAGATDEGEPYFLMEFVEGDPIDEYAKSHTLSVPARLKLFAQACRAVQFAHQRGILHRDLKPANLLVQHREEGPTVKLIDFGIARVADDTGASGLTGTSILGTPAYMAPEAFDREITADIRQDVYSLGLVLFELIVGTHPLRGKSAVEVAKSYAETRELDPSEIWRAADAKTQTVVLSERQSNPREMVDSLKGDLGAVIRKATAQDSDARYDSVSHLADDVGRYLDGYPVEATNPTTSDRFARFVARHRLIVAAAVLAVLSLVTGVVVSVRSAAQANAQAQIAKSAKSFLVDLFRSSDPTLSRGKELTVKQALKAGTEEILASPNTMDTKLRADMALTIGEVYYTLGAFDEAEKLLQLAGTLIPSSDSSAADVQCSLGKLLSDRRNKEDNPLEAIERCVKMRASHFPPGHPKLGLAYSLLAHEHCNAGELDACSDAAEQAVRSLRDHPEHGADYVAALQNLGSARSRLEDYEHAEPLLKQAVAAAKALGPEGDRRRALALNDLALHHMRTGEPTRAIATSEQVLAIYEQLLGADHPEIATMLHNIGLQKLDAGQAAEALPMMERAALLDAKSFGSDHWTVGYDKRGVGLVLLALERHDDAQRAIEEGLAIVKNALGAEHLRTRVVEESLARVYASMGRRETALTLATQSYKTFLEKEGENSKRARDAAAFIETLAP